MLSEYISKRIMNNLVSYFQKVAITDNGTTAPVGTNVSLILSNIQHPGLINLSWGTTGYSAGTTTNLTSNTVTSNPMTWTIPQNEVLSKIILTYDSGGNQIIAASFNIPSVPSYSGGSGAYHLRAIQVTMTEV